MKRLVIIFFLFLIVISPLSADNSNVETSMLNEEDTEIIQNWEILENLDMLEKFNNEDMDLLENIEVIENISEENNG